MSRTYRRKSGKRPWAKAEPDYVRVEGIYRYYGSNRDEHEKSYNWRTGVHRVPLVYSWKFVPCYRYMPVGPKKFDIENIKRIERDCGNYQPSRIYKEAVNDRDRACRRSELYKIKESCYKGFDDIYEYDPSFENSAQRALIWDIF